MSPTATEEFESGGDGRPALQIEEVESDEEGTPAMIDGSGFFEALVPRATPGFETGFSNPTEYSLTAFDINIRHFALQEFINGGHVRPAGKFRNISSSAVC